MNIEERNNKIQREVIQILDDHVGTKEGFTLDTHLAQYCDSLDQIEIVMDFEKTYGIAIPDEDMYAPRFQDPTVGEVVDYILERVNE